MIWPQSGDSVDLLTPDEKLQGMEVLAKTARHLQTTALCLGQLAEAGLFGVGNRVALAAGQHLSGRDLRHGLVVVPVFLVSRLEVDAIDVDARYVNVCIARIELFSYLDLRNVAAFGRLQAGVVDPN